MVGIFSVKVAHLRGKRRFGSEERGRKRRTPETVRAICWDVDQRVWINAEKIFQTGSVIGVAMGDNDEIQLAKINVKRFDVVFKDFGIVPGVEEDALSVVFDKGGEAPILREFRGVRECV